METGTGGRPDKDDYVCDVGVTKGGPIYWHVRENGRRGPVEGGKIWTLKTELGLGGGG